MPLHGTGLAKAAKVLGLLMDAGWCWAALGVAAGWLGASWGRGVAAAMSALFSATVGYFVTESAAGTDAMSAIVVWLAVCVFLGPALGVIGAAIRRPGLVGLLAALVVPVGAATQMVVLPPRPHLTVTPGILAAEIIVWAGAVLGAAWALRRFWVTRRTVPAP
ncbi:hypothetical protein ACFZAU_37305 [Streptomyces sp. NPDC008238]